MPPLKNPIAAVKDPSPTKPPDDPKNGTQVIDPPPVKTPEDPQPLENATDPVATDDAGTPDLPVAVSAGVLAKFVDNNSRVDDFTIGEFRREERDGQSIERMLARMNEAIKSDDDKKELFERALRRVNDLCSEADTKRKLIDCDDEARKLHERFFKL